MDFGIAKSLQAESRLTQTGVALGTAATSPPSSSRANHSTRGPTSSSLGVMAYELHCRRSPFAGPNISNVIYQICTRIQFAPHT